MKFDLTCPACGAELEAEAEPGAAVVCPACGRAFPAVEAPPAPPPPPAPRGRIVTHAPSSATSLAPPSRVVGRDFFWNSLLSLLLFFPVGVVAVAFACLAGGAREANDAERFAVYSSAARHACNAACICFLVGLVAWLAGCVVVGAIGHAAASALSAPPRV